MGEGVIPGDVEQFLASYVPSIAHLEALLLLRNEREAAWTVSALVNRLFISGDDAARVLTDLVTFRLVTTGSAGVTTYRYSPATPALAAAVDRTAEMYTTRLIAVSQFIHARQGSRIRQFADAFRIRKD